MEANDYQTKAMRTDDGMMGAQIRQKLDEEFFNDSVDGVNDVGGLIYAGLGLAGESGEVVEIIKKWVGQGAALDKAHLTEELGDVLWYAAKICDSIGIYMSDAMWQNLDKLWKRYPDGFDVERANNREDAKNVTFTVDNATIYDKEEPLLTVEEASELAEFLDMELIDIIRNDKGIENINWVVTMATAYKKLKEYSGYVGLYDPQPKCTTGDRWKTKEDEQ